MPITATIKERTAEDTHPPTMLSFPFTSFRVRTGSRGFLASSVGAVGRWLHFARGFVRGRRAVAFAEAGSTSNASPNRSAVNDAIAQRTQNRDIIQTHALNKVGPCQT